MKVGVSPNISRKSSSSNVVWEVVGGEDFEGWEGEVKRKSNSSDMDGWRGGGVEDDIARVLRGGGVIERGRKRCRVERVNELTLIK